LSYIPLAGFMPHGHNLVIRAAEVKPGACSIFRGRLV